jgi:hypothetical protein
MKTLGIQHTQTPPYNPESNPVERFHRTLNAMMRVHMSREELDWEQYLPTACLAYNSKVHRATGLSPYFALFGREPRLPVDLLVRLPHEEDMHLTDFVKAVRRRFQVMSEYIREQEESQITRNAHGYEGNPEDWKPGTLVWYFLPRAIPGKPKKLTNQWLGPWVVVEKLAPVLVKVKPANSEGEERIVHSSRLRLYQGKDGRSKILPQPLYVDEDEDDEPNVIRASPGADPGGSAAAAVALAWIPTGAAPLPP